MSQKIVDLHRVKSCLKKRVNLTLLDKSVIVNVSLLGIQDKALLKCKAKGKPLRFVSLREVVSIQPLCPYTFGGD